MTVAELIDKLREAPPDAAVVVHICPKAAAASCLTTGGSYDFRWTSEEIVMSGVQE